MVSEKNRFLVSLFFVNFSCDRATKRISECISGEVHIVSCRGGGYAENILLAKNCEEVLNLIQGG
jgi:hypothetical protein